MGRTTLTLHNEIMENLIKVRGLMESKNGKRRTLEDVISDLITFFETHKEREKSG